MKNNLIIFLFMISSIFSQSEHIHNHGHENEFGIALGIVPGHEDEDNNIGMHLHYVKGLGEHNNYGIGISFETIFDDHKHNSISLITTYHFDKGYTIAYAPGILFFEHDGKTETDFTQHFEFYYEFEIDHFHIGPQFDIGYEDGEIHYMLGVHFGINF